ncbi:MAG: hypothetical protein QOJ54_424 [Aliidongia sp.]|nr:hypothetical protein [Aliidongia sp.]
MIRWILTALSIIATTMAFPARAQLQPDPGETIAASHGGLLPPGATATMTNFGICVVATNHSQNNVQYMFASQAGWQSFVAHPAPGVTHSSCAPPPPAFCPSQVVSWSSSQCVGFLSGLNDGQSEVVTTGQFPTIPSPNSGSETLACHNGQLTASAQTCSAVPTSCTDSTGVNHPSGSTFTTATTSNESCVAAGFGAGATGNASTTTTTTFQCMAGSIIQIGSPTTSPPNVSQCVNSAGGQCVPFDVANPSDTCAQHNVQNAQPICLWTAAAQGQIAGRPPSFAWFAFEFKAHLNWTLSSNLCTCNPAVVTDGQVTPSGTFSSFPTTGVDAAPALSSTPPTSPVNLNAPNCPNASAVCTVQPQGSCN